MKQSRPITSEQALIRAEELCARAEHCSGEIREKLFRWGISAADSEAIIDSLIDRRFIDDARYAAAFVRDKAEFSGWGRRKIATALYAKRVNREIINTALDCIDQDKYCARLSALIARKAATLDDAKSYESRCKLFKFAASRGFEPELISKYLSIDEY
jgi:regulatory protein